MKFSKFGMVALVASMGLTNEVVAGSGVVEYNDRAAFEAALGSFTVLEFEGIGDQVNLGTSVDFGDLNISNGGDVWAIDGGFGSPTGQVGDQNNADTILTLEPGYKAMGMDMGLLFGAGQINITLRDEFGNVVASGQRAVTDNDFLGQNGSTFWGWISTSGDLISLQLDQGDFPTIDNLILGDRSPRPIISTEPVPGLTQWALMLLAALTLGMGWRAMRSRKYASSSKNA